MATTGLYQGEYPSLDEINAELDALDMGPVDPLAEWKNRISVNSRPRRSDQPATFESLVQLGFGVSGASAILRVLNARPLVRGIDTHLTPTNQPLPQSSSTQPTTVLKTSGAISAPACTRKLHRVHDGHVLDWWKALVAIPGAKPYKFDIRLSEHIRERALAQTTLDPCDWLRRRFNRLFKDAADFTPDMIFGVGVKSKGGPCLHVHLVAAIDPKTLPAVLAVMQAFAGPWDAKRGKERQIVPKAANSAGAALYVLQNAEEATTFVTGKTIVVSEGVKKAASEAWKAYAVECRKQKDKSLLTYHPDKTDKLLGKSLASDESLTHKEDVNFSPRANDASATRPHSRYRRDRLLGRPLAETRARSHRRASSSDRIPGRNPLVRCGSARRERHSAGQHSAGPRGTEPLATAGRSLAQRGKGRARAGPG